MQINVLFQLNHQDQPAAVTSVKGDIADFLLPSVGDVVRHRDMSGDPFEGKVTDRIFAYELNTGLSVDGAVSVTLCLDPIVVH